MVVLEFIFFVILSIITTKHKLDMVTTSKINIIIFNIENKMELIIESFV